MKPSKTRVKWRIFGYFTTFTALFVLLIWLVQMFFLDDIYRIVKRDEIKSIGKETEDYIADIGQLKLYAEEKSKSGNINFKTYLMNEDGTLTEEFSYESMKNSTIHAIPMNATLAIMDETVSSGGELLKFYFFNPHLSAYLPEDISPEMEEQPKDDIRTIVYSKISTINDKSYLILIDSTITPLVSTVKILNVSLIAVTVIMILLAFILAMIMSSKFARPIMNLNDSAKEFAKGNYDVRFNAKGYLEINELTATLNNAAEELSKVDELKKELIANVSHDLRTPLTMISGYAEMMKDLPGENTPENADIILKETQRLTSLVNDMLDISKLESGNLTVNATGFNLTDAISETVERYKNFKSADGYEITFTFYDNVIVNTDKSKLLQAFCNLINNAITYTGEDKRVDVFQTVFQDDTGRYHVRLSVSDTGEGIPEDKLSLIWDRYYKIKTNHLRSVQGSGLGLSIVRKIMDCLGGTCDVQSTEGKGSTFSIEIPI